MYYDNPNLQMQSMYRNYPYMQQQNVSQLPHYEVIKVNGKNGVDAFQMGPNSSILLLDETTNVVWLAQTDGAGYKTATPFTITPYEEKPPVDIQALYDKVINLENIVIGIQNGGVTNAAESNSSNVAEKQQQSRNRNRQQKQQQQYE